MVPQPGKKPKRIAISGINGSQISKIFFKSNEVKYINSSKNKKPQITQVVTKFVVSTTLDKRFLVLSVEH